MRFFLSLLIFSLFSYASVGTITALKGSVKVQRSGETLPIHIGDKIYKKDLIITGQKAKTQIILNDNTVVTIGKSSQFGVDDYFYKKDDHDSKAKLRFKKGFFKTITGKIGKVARKNFKIKTHNATIGIRGTQILSMIDPKAGLEFIACTKGAIDVVSNLTNQSVRVNSNELISLSKQRGLSSVHKLTQKIRKALNKGFDTKGTKKVPATGKPNKNAGNKANQKGDDKKGDRKKENDKKGPTQGANQKAGSSTVSTTSTTVTVSTTDGTNSEATLTLPTLADDTIEISTTDVLTESNDISTLIDTIVNDITQDVTLQTQQTVTDINLNFSVNFSTDTTQAIDPFQ